MNAFKNLFVILIGTLIGAIFMGLLSYISTLIMPDLMVDISQEISNNKELTTGSKGQQLIMAISLIIGAISGFVITALPILISGVSNIIRK
jgi:large-conductance mechanosensitive channel